MIITIRLQAKVVGMSGGIRPRFRSCWLLHLLLGWGHYALSRELHLASLICSPCSLDRVLRSIRLGGGSLKLGEISNHVTPFHLGTGLIHFLRVELVSVSLWETLAVIHSPGGCDTVGAFAVLCVHSCQTCVANMTKIPLLSCICAVSLLLERLLPLRWDAIMSRSLGISVVIATSSGVSPRLVISVSFSRVIVRSFGRWRWA